MTETTIKIITTLKIIVFLMCIGLVILGHEYIGVKGTFVQLAGLAGILTLVWNYNRKFK